jgi:hypothetical protein
MKIGDTGDPSRTVELKINLAEKIDEKHYPLDSKKLVFSAHR